MSPKYDTTIDLNVTSASDPMSVDNNDDELVLTRAILETPKTYDQPSTATSHSSRYTPRTT